MKTIINTVFCKDNEFYRKFFSIAIPTAIQSFIASVVNMIDNIMVGRLGDASIAAVGLSNQYYFVLHLILFAITSGAAVFFSQYWGSKNLTNIKKIMGLCLGFTFITSLVFFVAAFFLPEKIISIFSEDPQVIELGGSYLVIVCFSFIIMPFSITFGTASRNTGNIRLPLTANIIGIILNAILNFVLIFGMLGFPRMGIPGAALATVIARLVEATILISTIYIKKHITAGSLKEFFYIPTSLIKKFIKTSSGVIAKDVVWVVGVTAYMAIYARIGTEAVAAINIVDTIRRLMFVFFHGVASACLIMVGNQIGAKSYDTAYLYAKRFLSITFLCSLIICILTISFRFLFLMPYDISQDARMAAYNILFIVGIILILDVFNMVCIIGVLRSGGDVNFCLFLDITCVWLIGMPMALLGAFVLKLPLEGVYLMVVFQEVFKFALCYKRFVSRKWINDLVNV
ncbi:UNVERIFIED_CONTAM: putative MATE family efflux protein [Acetivibrio alkalicellulosi]